MECLVTICRVIFNIKNPLNECSVKQDTNQLQSKREGYNEWLR